METNQVLDVFTSLEIPVEEIRLTGGYTTIDTWNQIQADIYGKPVSTLENPEASIMGAALLAAVGTGAFSSLPEAVKSMVRLKKRYQPARENAAAYEKLYQTYCTVHEEIGSRLFELMN